ncbi:ubiquinone biosynthesis O-methyltransferase [Palaemon carinicauda]|uniref:ubiquinone biosynthesis O-methyltransferase n=1 Tax=Palaemon carinicauda TaxID=392227 RepID=UPI0035B5DAEB
MVSFLSNMASLQSFGFILTPAMCRCYSATMKKPRPKSNLYQDHGTTISRKYCSIKYSSDSDSYTQERESTFVEEEVSKFRSMASMWWDPKGDAKPLHALNRLRVSLIRDGLIHSGSVQTEYVGGPKPLTGLKILDVGSGGGILSEPLARLGATVDGLDAAEENVAVANLHSSRNPSVRDNISFMPGTVEEHTKSLKYHYDAVVASEVLEHIEATDLFVKTCSEALKPGGSLFLTTINKTAASWLGGILIAEYALRLLPTGTHDWDRFLQLQELLFILEKNGFVTRLVHGMAYNPLVSDWIWVKSSAINYAVHALKTS